MIPYGHQDIDERDVDAVVAALRSEWITQGPAIDRFERALAAHCGVPYAVAAASGTSALHLACRALDLGPGDLAWTSPNTFVASANCARYCGADVDFVDIDVASYNMSMDALEAKLRDAERNGRLPKVVIPVHFAGLPCDLDAIARLAEQYGFRVIEDASHAVGARYRGQPVGGYGSSDLVVFSFHPVKIVTTAEGGAIVTRNPSLARRAALLRNHGITRDPDEMDGNCEGPWYYQQIELGYNYRMTDLQAALGESQMRRLDEFLARRRHLADRYDRLLAGLPLCTPPRDPNAESAWHLYVIQLQLERLRVGRREIVEALLSRSWLRGGYLPLRRSVLPARHQPASLRRID
jgi:UDP-4-amino-4,6-dideoxy-N-acetyl-beta-L-altrosamine transaminase